jgi:hypothetical protein
VASTHAVLRTNLCYTRDRSSITLSVQERDTFAFDLKLTFRSRLLVWQRPRLHRPLNV